PNCTNISAYVVYTAPLTQAQINSINASQQSQFPNVVKLAEPTSSYNCHNYAFVKSEGGSEFWLNTPGDDAFWNDQSYVSTTNTAQANLKVSYQGDHSAVTTSVTNQAISKWGAWGLYRHNITDVPSSYLPNSTLTYYRRKPTITGPSLICSSGTFGLQDQPTGTSISWSSSFATGLAINATTGFSTRQNNFNGQVIITATITSACGNVVFTKNVTVGTPTPAGIIGPDYDLCRDRGSPYVIGTYSIDNPLPAVTYQWQVVTSSGQISPAGSGISTDLSGARYPLGCHTIRVRSNSCSTFSPWYESTFCVIDCALRSFNNSQALYPNPASDEVIVILGSDSLESQVHSVELVNNYQEVVYKKTTEKSQITIPVSKLPEGTYFLSIQNKEGILQRRVLIKH
ncbi:MAG: T9SS type A sorting domain-containing protein, partial [Flammeovirgaceae bacterium]